MAAHEGFLVRQARWYATVTGCHEELDDLLQEARLALLESIRRYRPDREATLTTFALYRIRERLGIWMYEQRSAIRVPTHVHRTLRKVDRFRNEAAGRQRSVTDTELAVHLGVRLRTWRRIAARAEHRALVRLVGPEDNLIIDPPGRGPLTDEVILARELHHALAATIATLSVRDREVVERTLGWNGRQRETLAAVGCDLKITRQRVHQIRSRALLRMRAADPSGILAAYRAPGN